MPEKSGIRFDHEHWKEKLSISGMILVAFCLTVHSVVTCRFLKANNYDYPSSWTLQERSREPPPAFYLGLFSFDDDDEQSCRSLRHDFLHDYENGDDAIGWAVRLARSAGVTACVVGSVVCAIATVGLLFWQLRKKWWRLFQTLCFATMVLQGFTFSLFWDDTCTDQGATTTTSDENTVENDTISATTTENAASTDLTTAAANSNNNNNNNGEFGSLGVECMTDIGGIVALSACLIYMFAFLSSFGIQESPIKPVVSLPACLSLQQKLTNNAQDNAVEGSDSRLKESLRFSFRNFSSSLRSGA